MYGVKENCRIRIIDEQNGQYELLKTGHNTKSYSINKLDLLFFQLISKYNLNQVAQILNIKQSEVYDFISYYSINGVLENLDSNKIDNLSTPEKWLFTICKKCMNIWNSSLKFIVQNVNQLLCITALSLVIYFLVLLLS